MDALPRCEAWPVAGFLHERSPGVRVNAQRGLHAFVIMLRRSQGLGFCRAPRRTAQQAAEAADALMLTAPPDQEWAYGNGWG